MKEIIVTYIMMSNKQIMVEKFRKSCSSVLKNIRLFKKKKKL